MYILFVSDFHNCVDFCCLEENLEKYPIPDVVFTMGDISTRELFALKRLIGPVPIYGICGNHDSPATLDIAEIPNVHGKIIEKSNISFVGFEGSVRYKRGDYTMFSQKESLQIMEHFPVADILVSHDRAFCGDRAYLNDEFSRSPHEGLIGISAYLRKTQPFLHVHDKNIRYRFNGIETISIFGAVLVLLEGKSVISCKVVYQL